MSVLLSHFRKLSFDQRVPVALILAEWLNFRSKQDLV